MNHAVTLSLVKHDPIVNGLVAYNGELNNRRYIFNQE